MKHTLSKSMALMGTSACALCLMAATASAGQVFTTDVIVQGSLCAGFDCTNGMAFGFDTIVLKENNLRLKFEDTSASASFPSNDWRLQVNDTGNGGANYFAIQDAVTNRNVFRVDAGAPANSMYVNASGNVGFGTATPVLKLDIVDGNTPSIRLNQDGSDGFQAQIWDIAGNEANFFIRDATNGNQLPFKIKPGADNNALFIASDNDIGLATQSPDAALHVTRGSLIVESSDSNSAPTEMVEVRGGNILIENSAPTNITLDNTADTAAAFRIQANQTIRFSYVGSGAVELELTESGNLTASGSMYADSFVASGTTLNVPDYVFADDYDLMPLSEVAAFIDANSHLPKIPSAAEINAGGLDLTSMQLSLLEKVEELTLYTLAQQDQIAALEQRLQEVTSMQ